MANTWRMRYSTPAGGGARRRSGFLGRFQLDRTGTWDRWFGFWHSYTATGNKLHVPLGRWHNPTHRIWKWFYREDTDELLRLEDSSIFHYKPATGLRFTRTTRMYIMSHETDSFQGKTRGSPISVAGLSLNQVTKLSTGPTLALSAAGQTDFWSFLHEYGGTWMWEEIDPGKDTPEVYSGLRMAYAMAH